MFLSLLFISLTGSVSNASAPSSVPASSSASSSASAPSTYPVHCDVATYVSTSPKVNFVANVDLKLVDHQEVEVARTQTAIYKAFFGRMNLPGGVKSEWLGLSITDFAGKEFARAQTMWTQPNKSYATSLQSEKIEPGLHMDFTCRNPKPAVQIP